MFKQIQDIIKVLGKHFQLYDNFVLSISNKYSQLFKIYFDRKKLVMFYTIYFITNLFILRSYPNSDLNFPNYYKKNKGIY